MRVWISAAASKEKRETCNTRALTPFGAPSPPASENVNNVTALVINAPPIQSTFKL